MSHRSMKECMEAMRSTVKAKESANNPDQYISISLMQHPIPHWVEHLPAYPRKGLPEREYSYSFGFIRDPQGNWPTRMVVSTDHVSEDWIVTQEQGDLSWVIVEDPGPAILRWVRFYTDSEDMTDEQYARRLADLSDHALTQMAAVVLSGSVIGNAVMLGSKEFDFRCVGKKKLWVEEVQDYRLIGTEYWMKLNPKDAAGGTRWWSRGKSGRTRGFVNGR